MNIDFYKNDFSKINIYDNINEELSQHINTIIKMKNIDDIYFHKEKIIKTWNNLENSCIKNDNSLLCGIYKYLNETRNTLFSELNIS